MQGRIIRNISNQYQVNIEGMTYECGARGKLKQDNLSPVVGDLVEIQIIEEDKKTGVINEILPRESFIKRPKLANISQILLVVSSKMPKPDLLMLDKQLALAEFLKIKPIIVINKVDLDEEIAKDIEQVYSNIGYSVIKTNATKGEGVEKIKEVLRNHISAFSGNSGVGKSSLLNSIFQKEVTEEGMVSQRNKRGKNTTTAICLYEIEKNTYVADTPGFSTFDIYEIEAKELAEYFIELKREIKNCEYIGCRHNKEKDCGIKKAVEKGTITKQRYQRYLKLYEDMKEREEHKW